MYWNHRVIEHKDGSLAIVEAFYDLDKDGEGFGGWAEASLYADRDEGLESLRGQVKWFEAALDKPILPAKGCVEPCCENPDIGEHGG